MIYKVIFNIVYTLCHVYSGDVDCPDNKGSTPLHVAATYGHLGALELMISEKANLYSLDDFGRTAAKVAAFYKKIECCRYLDTLAVQWEVQNQEYVSKLQKKAVKDLQKRTKKSNEEPKDTRTRLNYDYSTAPAGLPNSPRNNASRDKALQRPGSGEIPSRKGGKKSVQDALRQNFELRTTNSADDFAERNADDENLGTSKSATELGLFPQSGSSTFRPVHRPNQGPLINILSGLPLNIDQNEIGKDSVAPGVVTQAAISGSNHSHSQRNGGRLPQVELIASHQVDTENNSTLATFLHSIELTDSIQVLHKEKLDLEALALCSEQDLISIGLPLGPRKKILNAIEKRNQVIAFPSKKLTESEL